MPAKLPDSNRYVNENYNLEIEDGANDNRRMDDKETLNRRARLRELLRECFGDKRKLIAEHISARGHTPNLTELSNLKKDNGPRSFADKKAGMLTEEIGLHRRWFDWPLGSNLEKSKWMDELVPLDYVKTLTSGTESNLDPAPDLRPSRMLPVVGEVQGGVDGYLQELAYPVGYGEGCVEYPTGDQNAYALRVRGDSMHPRYRAGEFVIIEPSIEPPEGEDVIICCKDGRKMLKILNWIRDGEAQFLSVNNGYAPLTLMLIDIDSIQLVAGSVRRSAFIKA